jgi:hypothetical protein
MIKTSEAKPLSPLVYSPALPGTDSPGQVCASLTPDRQVPLQREVRGKCRVLPRHRPTGAGVCLKRIIPLITVEPEAIIEGDTIYESNPYVQDRDRHARRPGVQ